MITNNFVLHFVGGQAEQKENKRLKNRGKQLSFSRKEIWVRNKNLFFAWEMLKWTLLDTISKKLR